MTTPDWVTIATLQAVVSQAHELAEQLLAEDRVLTGADSISDSHRTTLRALCRLLDLPDEMLRQ